MELNRRLLASTLCLLGLAAAPACKDPRANPSGQAPAAGCDVLLITLDTTRADRLGCYGYAKAQTPNLDALAQRGVRFDQAFCQVPITLPSHTVILTGTNPPENGVRNNSGYALGPELPILSELFRQRSYQTGAFIASRVLDHRYGLARGFDLYADQIARHDRPANEVVDDALAWLESVKGRRYFAWVHLYDPHTPYTAPDDYVARAASPYDAEVAFMDAEIGRLLAGLRRHGTLDRTLIVVVGDHGESLGEHGFLWHSLLLYDSIMRVPLIFSLPGQLPAHAVRAGLVRTTDLMPTILALMGWDTPPTATGQSLLPDLFGETQPSRQSYGETDNPFEDYGWAKLRSLTEGRWKYIRAPEPELYDRLADPGELRNLASAHPDEVARLEQDLAALEAAMTPRTAASAQLDAASLTALRSLGYVGNAPPATTSSGALKNPKDMVEVAHKFREAEALLAGRRPLDAVRILEWAVAQSPESFVVVELLGKAYFLAELPEFAQLCLRDALALNPNVAETWATLARVLRSRGAFLTALPPCEKALELDPADQSTRHLCEEIRAAADEQRARLADLRTRVAAASQSIAEHVAFAEELSRLGETADEIRVLKAGLAIDPENPTLANNLAWALATSPREELRNGAAALRYAEHSARGELANSPAVLDTLAAALAEAGRFDEAVATARRAIKLAAEAGDRALAEAVQRRCAGYEKNRPFRMPQ